MMPQGPLPPIGADVTSLLAPVGEDVTALMGEAPTPPSKPAPKPAPTGQTGVAGVLTGAAKGLANTVIGLGEAAYDYVPGVSQVSDAAQKLVFGDVKPAGALFTQARKDVAPTTTAERIGQGVEQIGEFFAPVGAVGKVGKAAEVAKAGLLGRAQTGSTTQGAVTAGLSAIPLGGIASKAAGALQQSAEKGVARALGATKEWAKSEAGKLAPQMLQRGVGGSRPAMLAQASAQTSKLSKDIAAEVAAAAARGDTVSGASFASAIDKARQTLLIPDASGAVRVVPGAEAVVKRLDKLDDFVRTLGPDIPIDKAQKLKQTWDQIVSKAGLYGQKAGASSTDSANAWATREAASAFRKLISTGNPALDAINKEFAFWKGLQGVLKETAQRTQAQSSGLGASIMGAAGAGAGVATGTSTSDKLENALIYGLAGRNLMRLVQSPGWQTKASAPFKSMLASALASGSQSKIAEAVKRITSAMPAQYRPVLEAQ